MSKFVTMGDIIVALVKALAFGSSFPPSPAGRAEPRTEPWA
ncbi:hypothetical protein [Akkermansia muciniphila]|nr:hypothetical protein [Akkermansia muciniphila]